MITYTKPETYLASGFFLPMDSPAISKYDDTYVIIKYDLSDITNQTQKNWIQKANRVKINILFRASITS